MVLPQSVLHPDSLSAQECPISYLSALCAHLGAPTLHPRQCGLPISSLPSTPPLVLPTVPGLVPLPGISDGSSEHQDCSRLFESVDCFGIMVILATLRFSIRKMHYLSIYLCLFHFLSPVSYCLHYRGVSPHSLNLFLGILFFFMQL